MKNGINHKVKGENLKDASNFHLSSREKFKPIFLIPLYI